VHLCGDASSVELVRRIAAITGDTVEVHEYERLAPLGAAGECLEGVADVRAGDCVVAFSRATLYSLKESIEAATGLRCGVVYGALPPSVRRQQAAAFNDPDGTVDVLVGETSTGAAARAACPPSSLPPPPLDGPVAPIAHDRRHRPASLHPASRAFPQPPTPWAWA